MVDEVEMMETVDGSGSSGVFIQENRANWGSILATGNLHPSLPGAVPQQAREPKPAAGERPTTPKDTFPQKNWAAPSLSMDFTSLQNTCTL